MRSSNNGLQALAFHHVNASFVLLVVRQFSQLCINLFCVLVNIFENNWKMNLSS